mmetsp:Transcript_37832/g.68958  ORF Transcript_37832/g.68958 Transcript_37832/m.68958 type:complete len:703 (+) Transcript_37832:42-2150(+)
MGQSESQSEAKRGMSCCSCSRPHEGVEAAVAKAPSYPIADGTVSTNGIHAAEATPDIVPILLLHHLQETDMSEVKVNFEYLKKRIKTLLAWAAPLAPKFLRIVEFRVGAAASIVPSLFPVSASFSDCVEVFDVEAGHSPNVELEASRVIVCGGILEKVLYPCHDLLRTGKVREVGVVLQLCGTSGRSGELTRASTISHLEEVLGVNVLGSVKAAMQWLLPGKSRMSTMGKVDHGDVTFTVVSSDETALNDQQESVMKLLLPDNVVAAKLIKLGKGYSSALKFLVIPSVEKQGTRTDGAMTFIKLGIESEIEAELEVTQHMMQLLGNFCPQVLGYAELQDTAAVHLSLADLGGGGSPKGWADLYSELVSADNGLAGTPAGNKLLERCEGAIDFVFGDLVKKLHNSKHHEVVAWNAMDELGLSKDLMGGHTGVEANAKLSSGWVLEKLWKKKPGDGTLAGSVRIHATQILGEEQMVNSVFIFDSVTLPNICTALFDNTSVLQKLHGRTKFSHHQCFVHGDLHGDNIMIDDKDNRFLIDFGKTGLGHSLEDITWLESFIILSYTDIMNDDEFQNVLCLVSALAPANGLSPKSCEDVWLDQQVDEERSRIIGGQAFQPRIAAMWTILKCLRSHLGNTIIDVAVGQGKDGGSREEELRRAGLLASILFLRDCLFFMGARENKGAPRRRKAALALACAYAKSILAVCS